jgi:gas vesicle protein
MYLLYSGIQTLILRCSSLARTSETLDFITMSKFTSGFTLGILTGALAGAVVALLYAPDSGKNTRDKVSYKIKTLLDELNETLESLQTGAHPINDSESDRMVADAQQKAEDLIREAEDLLRNIGEGRP